MIVRFEDVITRVTGNVDRYNTDLEYYVGGDQYDSSALTIERRGDLKKDVNILGFKFHFPFKSGDVLLMARNPHLRKAGQVFFDGLCSDASYILRTKDSNVLLQDFIPILLQRDHFWDFFESHKTGGITFLMNWGMLKSYEFDLPPIGKQQEIMEKVWAAYRLKQSYQKLIEATDEMVKSRFIEMFGDSFRNEKGWKYNSLSKITTIVLGTTPSSSNSDYWDGDIKWITPAELNDDSFYIYDSERHITEAGVRSTALKSFPAGTVIFSTRAPIGKTAIAGCEMYCNQGFKNFICSDILNPVYLFYTLKSHKEELQKMGTGSTFLELSKKTIEGLSISTPPRDLQDEFEEIYKQADKSKFELKQAIEKIDKVMRALMQ